jgi:hypothetical protein
VRPWRYAAIVCALAPGWGGQVALGGPYRAISSVLKVDVVGERVGNLMFHSWGLAILGADLPEVQGVADRHRHHLPDMSFFVFGRDGGAVGGVGWGGVGWGAGVGGFNEYIYVDYIHLTCSPGPRANCD